MYMAKIRFIIPLNYCSYSGASLIRIIHLSRHLFWNQSPFLNRKWLTYPEIQLSGQSVWERRCLDKWGSTVVVIYTVKLHLSGQMFGNQLWLYIVYRESDPFIWIFSYPGSRLGNGGVRIHEGPLCFLIQKGVHQIPRRHLCL